MKNGGHVTADRAVEGSVSEEQLMLSYPQIGQLKGNNDF
jgi:hypothetical protein